MDRNPLANNRNARQARPNTNQWCRRISTSIFNRVVGKNESLQQLLNFMPPLWRIIQIGRNFEISMRNCVLLLNAKRKRYVLSPEDLCSLKVWICGQFDTTIRMCVCMVWYRTFVGNELPSPHTEVLRSELIIIYHIFFMCSFFILITHPISLIPFHS